MRMQNCTPPSRYWDDGHDHDHDHGCSLAFYDCVRYLFVQEMSMLRPLRLSRLNALGLRCNSTASPATPPLMAKIRTDLKTAMRAKETLR